MKRINKYGKVPFNFDKFTEDNDSSDEDEEEEVSEGNMVMKIMK